jgi:phosphoribosylaminoimidazolecarboxamide formyltransferase/IMP cyclohydrolase
MAVNLVEQVEDRVPLRRAIVSVSDKSGLAEFVPGLVEACPGIRFYSTGGTFDALRGILGDAKDRLVAVSEYTGQPEMQGGLVKTLDFKIYLGLLSESFNPAHKADLARTGSEAFDLVVVNLYPFREAIAKPGATAEAARANIDIGGPCMLRASAKNWHRVAVVVDPKTYPEVLAELRKGKGALSLEFRFGLARRAFAHTAAYDGAISEYLSKADFKTVKACYRIGKA